LPCSLTFDGDAIVLGHSFGLAHRRVTLPCSIEVGTLTATRPDPITAQYDVNAPGDTVRVGRYLRFVNNRSITIGCKQAVQLAHWKELGTGKRRGRCDITVSRPALASIEYELAQRGLLVPA
jgi:hypothetical protein